MRNGETREPLPKLVTDVDAERFVEEANLEDYDLSDMTVMRLLRSEIQRYCRVRLPVALVDAVKAKAKARGILYQRFIREALERALEDSS